MNIQYFIKQNVLLFLVILLASIVFLTNLGGQGYSLDEPQTVAIARTILTFGYPSGWDGKTFLSGSDGRDFTVINGMYFWTWHPWLQFYLIVPFYFFFGNSIAMLRFPFALLGVITVIVLYLITQDIFKKKWIAALLSLQLTFLIPFFLYARQVRYYSLSALLSVLLFWLLLRFVDNRFNKKLIFVFLLTGLLLFSANYLIWLSCLPLFFFVAILKKNKPVIFVILFESLVAFIWFHFFKPYGYGGGSVTGYYFPGRPNLLIETLRHLSYFNNFVFPFIVFPLTVYSAWRLRKLRYVWIAALWIGEKVIIYSLLVDPHGRNLVDIMPVSLLFFGFIYLFFRNNRQPVLILLLFFATVTTNFLSLVPAYLFSSHLRQFRFYPQDLTTELTGSYPPPYLQVSDYLSMKAKPGDLFWSNYARWDIYLYANVPTLSNIPICGTTTKLFVGKQNLTQQSKVRWFIFYQGLPQSLNAFPCLGSKWQKYMVQHYTRRIFPLDKDTYALNDPDIVNRQFPPGKIPPDSVIIYEKE